MDIKKTGTPTGYLWDIADVTEKDLSVKVEGPVLRQSSPNSAAFHVGITVTLRQSAQDEILSACADVSEVRELFRYTDALRGTLYYQQQFDADELVQRVYWTRTPAYRVPLRNVRTEATREARIAATKKSALNATRSKYLKSVVSEILENLNTGLQKFVTEEDQRVYLSLGQNLSSTSWSEYVDANSERAKVIERLKEDIQEREKKIAGLESALESKYDALKKLRSDGWIELLDGLDWTVNGEKVPERYADWNREIVASGKAFGALPKHRRAIMFP